MRLLCLLQSQGHHPGGRFGRRGGRQARYLPHQQLQLLRGTAGARLLSRAANMQEESWSLPWHDAVMRSVYG